MSYKHKFKSFSIYVPTKNMWSSKERWVVFEADAHRAIAKAYEQGKLDAIKEARNAEAPTFGG